MKLEFKKATREDWITALVVILMIAIPLGVSIFIRSAKPQTMIGEEGLLQMKAYLLRFAGVAFLRITICTAALIVYLVKFFKEIKYAPTKTKLSSVLITLAMLGILYALCIPRSSRVDVQGERFSKIPSLHAFALLYAVEQDLHSDPVELYADTDLSSISRPYQIHSGSRGRRGRKATYETEYALMTIGGTTICQISSSDYHSLYPYIASSSTHQVMVYPHSGMLFALDHGSVTPETALSQEEYDASQYTLTYDEDGWLRWTPVGDHLTLMIFCDGQQRLGWNADGKTEYDPPFWEGHENTAYLAVGHTRVSNIITVQHPYVQETTE